jgi:hypothetical protein
MAQLRRERDREKRRTYSQLEPNEYPFLPLSVETYGRLGRLAISFLGQLGFRRRRQSARLASLALWRLPSVSLVWWGCARVTIRCIGHRWACLQGCPAVGSVRELLTPRRRCCDRYQCTDLGYVPWTGRSGLRYVWSSEKILYCLHAVCSGSHHDCLDTHDLVLSLMSWCKAMPF